MRLRVIVEVVDDETRSGTRRRKEVEVPSRVLNVHKVLCESRKELRAFVADDVMSSALSAVMGRQNNVDALSEALSPEPIRGNAHGQTSSRKGASKVEALLGLDVIEHMDGLDNQTKRYEANQEAQAISEGATPAPKFEWGHIGFGPDRGR